MPSHPGALKLSLSHMFLVQLQRYSLLTSVPPSPPFNRYIWIYWINPLRYMLQGFVVNDIGGQDERVDGALESFFSWSYDDRWWYCYVVTLLFGCLSFLSIMAATRISWLKR